MQLHLVDALHAQAAQTSPAPRAASRAQSPRPRRKRLQHLRRKVQSGRRRGHRAALPRKNRLVALAVRRRIVAMNIRRQRHVADPLEHREKISTGSNRSKPLAKLARAPAPPPQAQSRPSHPETPGARRWPPFVPAAPARATRFSPAGSVSITSMRPVGFSRSRTQRPPRIKPRRNHAAVIEHQQIARPAATPADSANFASRNAPVARSMTSMRLCPRSAGGCCAISSSGKSKSKSATRNRRRWITHSSSRLPEMLERPQPRAFDRRIQLFALRLKSPRARSARHIASIAPSSPQSA